MTWKPCGNNRFRRKDQKLSFGYDAREMPVIFHRRDIKWAVGYVSRGLRGKVQVRIIMVEASVSQNT